MAFSYLQISSAKRWALAYRAAGLSPDELCERIPNTRTGEDGIEPETLNQWMHRDAIFRDAWDQTEANPSWCQLNIIAPWLLTTSLVKDLEYLQQKDSKGFSPKKMELLMTQLGLINQVDEQGAQRFLTLMNKAQLNLPTPYQPRITVVDVTAEQET